MEMSTAIKRIAEQTGMHLKYNRLYKGWAGEDDNVKVVIWQDHGRWMQAIKAKRKNNSTAGQAIRDIVRQLNA